MFRTRSRCVGAVWAIVAACCCAVGCEREGGDCGTVCEKIASLECGDPEHECLEDCREFEAELPDECRSTWKEFLACVNDAEWSCDAPPCIRDSDSESCSSPVPEFDGCDSEENAFSECLGDGDGCDQTGGGGTGLADDGRTVDYQYSSGCDPCQAGIVDGAAPGSPCAQSSDCTNLCCACGDGTVSAQVCLGGLCAAASEACDPSLLSCGG